MIKRAIEYAKDNSFEALTLVTTVTSVIISIVLVNDWLDTTAAVRCIDKSLRKLVEQK